MLKPISTFPHHPSVAWDTTYIFQKKQYFFFSKRRRTIFEGHDAFEENGASDSKSEYNVLLKIENKVLNMFSFNNFSKKSNIFRENRKKILGA